MKCPRCKSSELRRLPESTSEIDFYECSPCQWQYAKEAGQQEVHDRWLSPISLVLYGIIFDKVPLTSVERIADNFLKNYSDSEIEGIVREIDREIANPIQKVSEILELVHSPSEETVRAFLHGVNNRIKSKFVKGTRGNS